MDFTGLTLSDYILIVGCIVIITIALRILFVGIRASTNIFFSITLIFLSLYVFSNFMIDYVKNEAGSTFWIKSSAFVVVIGSTSLYLFSRSFNNTISKGRKIFDIVSTYSFGFLLAIFSLTDYVIQGANVNIFPVGVVRGPFYYVVIGGVFFYLFIALLSLYKSYRVAHRIEKYQLKYILAGLGIVVFITLVSNIILPHIGQNEYSRIGPSFSVILAVMGGYALTSTNLSDLNFILLRSSFFTAVVMFYLTLYSIVYQWLNQVYGSIYSFNSVIVLLIFGSLSIYLLNKIRLLEDIVLQTLDRSKRLDIYNKVSQIFIQYRTTKEIIPLLEKYLSLGFQSKKVKVNLKTSPDFYDFQTDEILSIDKLSIRLLRGFKLDPFYSNIYLIMKKIKASLIMPLVLKNEVLGNIIFEEKTVSIPYTANEIQFLRDLADSIVVGLKKVLLYEQVRGFNETLQKKIDDATQTLQVQKKQLEEKYQFEKDMMGILGHELRTPMTVARGMAELLMQKLGIGEEIAKDYLKEKLEKIFSSITRESDLIQTMLSTSHIDNNKINFHIAKIDILEMIDFAIFSFKKDAESKGLELSFIKPDMELPEIISDQSRLQEVINNLISNGIKYTNKGSVIARLEKEGEYIKFSVQDTGIGIPKAEIPNIGRKFYRIHQHLDEKKDIVRAGGTGLGLYVVKGLLEAMGGRLEVESQEGKGSTFTAIFPVTLKDNDKLILSSTPVDEHDMFQKLGLKKGG